MIGILSTLGHPLLPGYLACLKAYGISDYAVICDQKGLSDRQQQLFLQRLGGWSAAKHFNYNLSEDAWATPFYFVSNHNSADSVDLINKLACSFLLNAGTPRKLDPSILGATKHGVLNVHPGKLPEYRGKNCPEWAVFYGERVVLTAHIMESEYDEGDVLGLVGVDWRSLCSYIEFRKQVYLKSLELAASVSLALSRSTSKVLYSSKDSEAVCGIRDAMDDETMKIVKSRFPGSAA